MILLFKQNVAICQIKGEEILWKVRNPNYYQAYRLLNTAYALNF